MKESEIKLLYRFSIESTLGIKTSLENGENGVVTVF
jgi:hypothetical protein